MPPGATLRIDTTGFQSMARELSRLSGADFRLVIRDQTARVLETAIKYTPQAKVGAAKKYAEARLKRKFNLYAGGIIGRPASSQELYISTTKKGARHWLVKKIEGKRKFYIMKGGAPSRKWSAALLAEYQAELADREADLRVAIAEAVKRAGGSVGLARNSWLQIAHSLNLALRSVPPRVAAAKPSDGRTYLNGHGAEHQDGGGNFYLELINRFPPLTEGDGARILSRALATRLRAFQVEVQKGVFRDLALRATRYPGIFTAP